jgi:hypothetical protein
MAERRTKEMEEQTIIESAKAIHEYKLAREAFTKAKIDLEAAKSELLIVQRDEERAKEIYARAKADYKELQSSGRLKSAYKVAKKNHLDVLETLRLTESKIENLENSFKEKKLHKIKKNKHRKKFEEGGRGVEKDWRLRQSKYGLGMPNSPAEQMLNMLQKNKEEFERRKNKEAMDKHRSKAKLLCGDRNRNRVVKSSIDLLHPLSGVLVLRRGEDTTNATKDPLKIPAWLYRLVPGGGRIIASKYRWNGTSFPGSV